MRLNKFIAAATGMSRRSADKVIADGTILINGTPAQMGQEVDGTSRVTMSGKPISLPASRTTILFNKPVGYVVSRDGQGSRTIYELLPPEMRALKPVGRLDKYSSGVLLLTDDGELAQQLTHPKYQKTKVYEVKLKKDLQPLHRQMIADIGVSLPDGRSQLGLERIKDGDETQWQVTMHEGRNRQIRRTFESLGYDIARLHRTHFGTYALNGLQPGDYRQV